MNTCFIAVATAVSVLSTLAHGANVVVQKNGQFPTIQAGVGAAGANGTVTVKPGIYEETVVIGSNRPGLTLKASGNVIIDARLANGDADGPGIACSAEDVTIRGFTIRHAKDAGAQKPGAGVRVTAPGARLEKLKLVNCSDYGVMIEATDAVVKNCIITGSDFGVWAQVASNLVIENTQIRKSTSSGIFAGGNFITARKNTVQQSGLAGIRIVGMAAIVEKNSVAASESYGISVNSEAPIIRGNKVVTTYENAGIVSSGHDALIEKNLVVDSRNAGIFVAGDQPTIRKNHIRNTSSFDQGIFFDSGPGAIIESNVIDGASIIGIYATSTSLTVRKNVVLRAGRNSGDSTGFNLSGTGATIEGNIAKDCQGDGFKIFCIGSEIAGNVATGNSIDGFEILGANNFAHHNVATKNSGEGFDLEAPSLSFKNNAAKQNRIDVAASLQPTTFQANSYGTGGVNVLPEID